jgi:hypothetical protein
MGGDRPSRNRVFDTTPPDERSGTSFRLQANLKISSSPGAKSAPNSLN